MQPAGTRRTTLPTASGSTAVAGRRVDHLTCDSTCSFAMSADMCVSSDLVVSLNTPPPALGWLAMALFTHCTTSKLSERRESHTSVCTAHT
jgi:hypothetical protein